MVRKCGRGICAAGGAKIVVAVALGIAVFYGMSAIVTGLVGPLIAVFIGGSRFELNSFTIGASEFRYGAVLEALFTVGLVAGFWWWLPGGRGLLWGSKDGLECRACPKCTMDIPAGAERCPYCTEILGPQSP